MSVTAALIATAAIGATASISAGVANKVGSLIDVQNSPTKAKSLGNVSSAVLMNNDVPLIEKWAIDDYDIVANTYEKTGYRVDIVDNSTFMTPFVDWMESKSIPSIRHYFNPLQLASVTLEAHVNVPNGLIGDFEMRLKNGIRFWNVDNDDVHMGDFEYDNVEEAYLANG